MQSDALRRSGAGGDVAEHLTPTELARALGWHRREVILKCMELGVPIFQGRIDEGLFKQKLEEARAQHP